jgi:hypothetical protein
MEGFIYIRTINYEANLIYCISELKQLGINCRSTIETSETGIEQYLLYVEESEFDKSKEILNKIKIEDEIILSDDSEGYVKGHLEWNNKMLDPGYYTGGRMPHYYYGKRNKKFYLYYFIAGGILTIYLSLSSESNKYDNGISIGLFYLVIGIVMFLQLRKKK